MAAGAFGAHTLKGKLAPDMIAVFELAVRYQLYHALALIALGAAMDQLQPPTNMLAGWILVFGTLIFSGTLYLLSLSGARWGGDDHPDRRLRPAARMGVPGLVRLVPTQGQVSSRLVFSA